MSTEEWRRVFSEAAALGVLHLGLSGGEPLARQDLAELVRAAHQTGLYSNLITSGLGLTSARARDLQEAGLDSVQISFQADDPALANAIAGTRAHDLKLEAVRALNEADLPLSLNVVLHRANIERLEQIIALAEKLGAVRLELANVQYYGWGKLNQAQLLPTRAQIEAALAVARTAKARLAGRMDLIYVLPDYYEERPKPCMQGWGRRYLTVNPVGQVLPCPNATSIPGLIFDSVRERSLIAIWQQSESFNRFRGTEWMPLPCRECPQKEIDFGGCRCQAALLTGNPDATDPVCTLSPDRKIVDELLDQVDEVSVTTWTPRGNPLEVL
jgi:pyrroloquinoline quinone biosynthesis protein E